MARRRRYTRRQKRLIGQATVLISILVLVSLGTPARRANADAILVWLGMRLGIGAAAVLLMWWVWEFARPPKVKRRKHKSTTKVVHPRPHSGKHVATRRGSIINETPRISAGTVEGSRPPKAGADTDTPPYGFPPVDGGIPQTRDRLIKGKMSGVHPLWTEEDE
jgi:hypothetical protein